MKILLIVDVQNGFVRSNETKAVAQKIVQLSKEHKFNYIIASKFINNPDSPYVNVLKWNRLMKSPETDLVDELKYDESFEKGTYTCWSESFAKKLLEINGGEKPESIYLCGIDTDCCVLNTAIDLFERGICPKVLIDYCFSNGGQKYHDAAISILERNIGKDNIVHDI